MYLRSIKLLKFRNLSKSFNFSDKINLIIGKNGIGKTNLLEAVYYLTTGKSFRVSNDEHLMGWDLPNGDYSILTASFFDELANSEIEVKIALKKVNGSSPLKLILLNKKKTTIEKIKKKFRTIVFAPNSVNLISSLPSYRRSNLDEFVEIFDEDYFKLLSSYKKILKNRNLLLERIKNKSASINELDFWNESLVLFGSKIIFKRINALKVLNQFIKNCEQKILSKTKKFNLSIKYKCRFLSDDLNEIKQNFSKKIEEYKSIEISAKKTLFGPQRDDVEFLNQSNNLAFSGSRGEQRLAILIEKLAILDYLNKKSQKPIILFDDIFSELDKETSKKIQDYLSTLNAQICISSVAKNLFEKDFLKKTNIIEIN